VISSAAASLMILGFQKILESSLTFNIGTNFEKELRGGKRGKRRRSDENKRGKM